MNGGGGGWGRGESRGGGAAWERGGGGGSGVWGRVGDRNSGNLPYLVANTYSLNFIKIGGISIFRGQKPLIRGLTIIERS